MSLSSDKELRRTLRFGKIAMSLKSWIIILLVLSGLFVTCISGCRRAGDRLVVEDVPGHADAMVLLMGTFPPRVLQAVDLYNNGKTGKIIIVKEYMGAYKMLADRGVEVVGTTAQARNALITLGIPADSIIVLPGEARSTMDEVIVTRDYLLRHPEVESLIVVSSPSHMRRARMIFRAAMKNAEMPVSIWCSPSAYTGFNPEKWWRNKEDIQIVLSEYLKITSFRLFEKRTLNKQSE